MAVVQDVQDQPHQDGWESALTLIGNPNGDKRTSHKFQGHSLTYQLIADLWERDDIAAKAIEAPTSEAFREGYNLTFSEEGKDDLKEKVLDKLEELGLDKAIERAYQYRRAYGGAAVLIGTDDSRPLSSPLDTSLVHSVDFLNVFEPIEIEPASNYQNPFKAKYGEPEFYRLTGARAISPNMGPQTSKAPAVVSPLTYIHESRLIVFQGIQTSNFYLPMTSDISPFWGVGIMPRFYEQLRDCGVAYAGAGLLATDVSQPVITIEGLREMVAKNETKLIARMRALEMGRSVARAILLDAKGEKFDRQTTQLTGISDILDRLSQRLAAAVGIPLSVLFGYSPASLGTPDNKELELWYNYVRALQRRELGPPIRQVIKLVMGTMRQRGLPKHWCIDWKDLEHMTLPERIEAKLNQGRLDTLDVKNGAVYPDEIRKSRYGGGYSYETQVDSKKDAPGFMAPLPAGVQPAPGDAPPTTGSGAVGPGGHTVGGYVRKNPVSQGEPVKIGGGAVAERGDAGEPYTAANELAGLQAARARGGSPAVIALFDQLIAVTTAEAQDCEDDTCGDDCVYEHSGG